MAEVRVGNYGLWDVVGEEGVGSSPSGQQALKSEDRGETHVRGPTRIDSRHQCSNIDKKTRSHDVACLRCRCLADPCIDGL